MCVCGGEAWVLVWVYGSIHLKIYVENFGKEDKVTRWKVTTQNEDGS